MKIKIHVYHHWCDKAPPKPGRVSLGEKRELPMSQFGLKFQLPAPGATDVTKRELTVTVNNGDPVVKVYDNVLVSDEWIFDADVNVVVSLIDVDGHGNRSVSSNPFSFTVTDDIAPPQPGELGVSDKRQID